MRKILSVLVTLILAAFFITSCVSVKQSDGVTVAYQYKDDTSMWNHLFSLSSAYLVPQEKPVSVIVPHHDITVKQQNSIYKAVSKLMQPEVIVVIGPDHYEKGLSSIAVPASDVLFTAPNGTFETDLALIEKLKNDSRLSSAVSIQSEMWEFDHAIYSHTPFLKKYFPHSKILPVLLKPLASDDEFEDFKNLADFLYENLPESSLVIASVDFSHYQIPRMTALHDYVTKNTIQNRESVRHVEIDSPETISCIMRYNALKGADRPVLIDMTSTYDFIPDEKVECTSHQYWAFYKPNADEKIQDFMHDVGNTKQKVHVARYDSTRNQTILIGGSGPLEAGIQTYWVWDRYKTSEEPSQIALYDLAGKEARFLSGFDAIVFDPKPGTTFKRNLHGTTLEVDSINASEAEAFIPPKKTEPEVSVLVITADGSQKYEIADFARFYAEYNVVVLRSDDPLVKAYAHVAAQDNFAACDFQLGTAFAPDNSHIEGMVLALNWYDGTLYAETFPYEGKGTIPPIEQFLEE
ncbi:MAG: AmmeMemoRadiSam system protein B [Treponema sp.]|nr:AmmeMemoRadiSam system protein B [Treponema sp.]